MDQSNKNAFTPSVSRHKYLKLSLFDLRFLPETNLSIVKLPHLLFIISTKLEVVNQSSLSMFLLSASACVLYFRGIEKTENLILKDDVISKIFSASSCNFSLLLCLQLNYLQNYRYTSKQLHFWTYLSRISGSNESLLILSKKSSASFLFCQNFYSK